MKHIYHILTLIFIMNELSWIVSPKSRAKSSEKYWKLHKEFKGIKFEDWSEEWKEVALPKMIIGVLLITWSLVGLLSFNWVVFVVFMASQIIIIAPISKLLRFSFAYTVLHWFNSVIGLVVGLFILINSYHLKIDLWDLISKL